MNTSNTLAMSDCGQKEPKLSQNLSPPLDRRAKRTRKALHDALVLLMKSKNWNDISITNLCKQADLARSSFYVHYDNKSELLDAIFDAQLQQAHVEMVEKFAENPLRTFYWLVDHISQNPDFFLNARANPTLMFVHERFTKMAIKQTAKDFASLGQPVEMYRLHFATHGLFGVIEEWAADPQRDTFDTMAKRAIQLMEIILLEKGIDPNPHLKSGQLPNSTNF